MDSRSILEIQLTGRGSGLDVGSKRKQEDTG